MKKAKGACAQRMSAAALGFRGLPLTRGSPEGCRVTALWRGAGARSPRRHETEKWDSRKARARAHSRRRVAALTAGVPGLEALG